MSQKQPPQAEEFSPKAPRTTWYPPRDVEENRMESAEVKGKTDAEMRAEE
jgi:hypothetical protein